MEVDIKQWEERKRQIEKAKEKISETKGKKESLLARLKKDFDCSSVEEGEKKLRELEASKNKLEEQLSQILGELETYDWEV